MLRRKYWPWLDQGVIVAAWVFACAVVIAPSIASAQNPQKWRGWWELGGYYGSDESSRGEVTIFQPLTQSASSLFFVDLRGKFFEEDTKEGNFALGHRRMLNSGWNFGVWGGFDVRNTNDDNTFWQASGGLEMLSDRWDVRVNGYAPLTDPKGAPSVAEVLISGNNIFMVGGEEVALHGVDGEIGYLLHRRSRRGGAKDGSLYGRRHELRVFGGGFWFDSDDVFKEVAGPRARLEYRIEDVIESLPGSRLTLETEISHDEVRDTKWEVGAKLRIPFGASREEGNSAYASLSPQARRMTEGLERDTDIVMGQSEEEAVIDPATEVQLNTVEFANTSAAIFAATASGANEAVIVDGVGGPIDFSAGSIGLGSNRSVFGSTQVVPLRGARTGTTANFRVPGRVRPTIETTGSVIFTLNGDRNTHLAGFDFSGTDRNAGGNIAIDIRNASSNIVLGYNTISDFELAGIIFQSDPNTNILIHDTTITRIGGANGNGVSFGGNNNNITFDNVTINDVGRNGIRHANLNDINNITVRNSTISNTGAEAITSSGGDNLKIMNTAFLNTASGVAIGDNTTGFTVTGSSFLNTGAFAIAFGSSNTGINISGNSFTDTARGIFASGINNSGSVANNTWNGNFATALIVLQGAGNALTGTGNVNNATGTFCSAAAGNAVTKIFFTNGLSCTP